MAWCWNHEICGTLPKLNGFSLLYVGVCETSKVIKEKLMNDGDVGRTPGPPTLNRDIILL